MWERRTGCRQTFRGEAEKRKEVKRSQGASTSARGQSAWKSARTEPKECGDTGRQFTSDALPSPLCRDSSTKRKPRARNLCCLYPAVDKHRAGQAWGNTSGIPHLPTDSAYLSFLQVHCPEHIKQRAAVHELHGQPELRIHQVAGRRKAWHGDRAMGRTAPSPEGLAQVLATALQAACARRDGWTAGQPPAMRWRRVEKS